ncbi:hypothetical protein FRC07_003583 [Ceratobasidium sp. 392]|nr:hypothetical protein FRC07_003583 [Ceratobasidium sp. 392]
MSTGPQMSAAMAVLHTPELLSAILAPLPEMQLRRMLLVSRKICNITLPIVWKNVTSLRILLGLLVDGDLPYLPLKGEGVACREVDLNLICTNATAAQQNRYKDRRGLIQQLAVYNDSRSDAWGVRPLLGFSAFPDSRQWILPNVRRLNIDRRYMGLQADEICGILTTFGGPSLTSVRVSGHPQAKMDLACMLETVLARPAHLQELELLIYYRDQEEKRICPRNLKKVLKAATTLTALSLDTWLLKGKSLEAASHLPNLETLTLEETRIGRSGNFDSAAFERCCNPGSFTKLRHLKLTGNWSAHRPTTLLFRLGPIFSQLRSFTIRCSNILDGSVPIFEELRQKATLLRSLQVFDCANTSTAIPLSILLPLGQMALTELSIPGRCLEGSDGLQQFLDSCAALRSSLNIFCMEGQPVSLLELRRLAEFPQLRMLTARLTTDEQRFAHQALSRAPSRQPLLLQIRLSHPAPDEQETERLAE